MAIEGKEKCKKCGNIEKWYYKPPLIHVNPNIPIESAPLDRHLIQVKHF